MPLISVRNLAVTLNNHRVLDGVAFDVDAGDIVAIIGPNGSGKTTLLRAMLGLVPYTGEVSVLGLAPGRRPSLSSKIGYVPQRLEFDRTMPVTVRELLSIFLAKGRTPDRPMLRLVGVETLLDRMVGILSGGEFQRVLLALALLNRPEILFLDEPASSIDIEGAQEMYNLIEALRKEKGITVLLVSHDVDVVYRYATKVLCVNHRLLCHGAPRETLTKEVMEKLYGGPQALYEHGEKRYAGNF